ncbi:ribonuclease HII [Schaalia suimastitidis]|uniref:ribonuclease HII n=1 Tax=Schaalia suimastitidis TaxID=121163 RepID=UPI00040561A6|nr:ribonuclease HII [Schaalia suimastitidis]
MTHSNGPTRDLELSLCAKWGTVIGIDEVGRGALAGPLAVGVALVDAHCGQAPPRLADSKLLSATTRTALAPRVANWVCDSAVGWASAEEIDRWGITCALRLAARRGIAEIEAHGHTLGGVLLDGSHNWLTTPNDLLSALDGPTLPGSEALDVLPVVTQVKGDRSCAVVAAASILAKVARDDYMATLPDPGYAWASNKGYASAAHISALREMGPSQWHRRSWKLPGVDR